MKSEVVSGDILQVCETNSESDSGNQSRCFHHRAGFSTHPTLGLVVSGGQGNGILHSAASTSDGATFNPLADILNPTYCSCQVTVGEDLLRFAGAGFDTGDPLKRAWKFNLR